jgi:hypothetical protein
MPHALFFQWYVLIWLLAKQLLLLAIMRRCIVKLRALSKVNVFNTDGTSFPLILTDVLYVPDLCLTLLSITKAIQHDTVQLGSSRGNMTLTIGPPTLTFD